MPEVRLSVFDPKLPTPGYPETAYHYPDRNAWYPVIYYPAGEVVAGEGPIHLVEPFPAARADGSDGCDPIENDGGACVAVVRHAAAPIPRGGRDRNTDGDWIVPERAPREDCVYDTRVATQAELLPAWREAYAIAATLNTGLPKVTGLELQPVDIDVLLAAERGLLEGDSRFAGTINELRWKTPWHQIGSGERVPTRQRRRLRDQLALIEPGDEEKEHKPARPERSTSSLPWTTTTYRLTDAGRAALEAIRRHGVDLSPSTGDSRVALSPASGDNPEMPSEQVLVTERTALLIISAAAARLGDSGFSIDQDKTAGWPDMVVDLDDNAACAQMFARFRYAVVDGYAEKVGGPDDDGYRLLRITPAGAIRLDRTRHDT